MPYCHFAAEAERFLVGLIAGYGDHILPVDKDIALESGRLEAKAVIAGTASIHKLTVITANLKHFLPFGVAVKSPNQVGR